MAAPKSVVVLGGGISGLSTAYYLHKFCSQLKTRVPLPKIVVVESSSHLGGWLKTCTFDDGVRHELGPKTLRVATNSGYNALSLVGDLGLSGEVVGTSGKSVVSQKRFIVANDELVQLPNKVQDLLFKRKPFTKRLISYVIQDLRTPVIDLEAIGRDISVYDYVQRRLGTEIADYFIDPLCRGITAGNSKKLSVLSVFPDMVRGEQESGAIIAGAITNAQKTNVMKSLYDSPLITEAQTKRWSTYTFNDGMQALPNRLCDYMMSLDDKSIEIYNDSTVKKIDFDPTTRSTTISISTPEDNNVELEASHVFSAIPARNLASVLSHRFGDLSESLNDITSVHMAVINLEFKGKLMPDSSGFGFLVPSRENSNILGIVYDSCVSPQFNANKDITRLTVMMGGEWFEEIFGTNDVDNVDKNLVLNYAVDAVRKYLKIGDKPYRHIVSIHKNCIPQYYLGHSLRLAKIDELVKKHSLNMTLVGASYQGFSVPDCIYYSKLAAESYAQNFRRQNKLLANDTEINDSHSNNNNESLKVNQLSQ
ncbi:protoporphyrinogen oxidase-like [Oppia nitens]|uniref:protoporphyrinogen oxidase-like n=1 Tax=Oppia nitens TaxID=1686743 RepID=UPI0023DC72C0|nr:protoporphyrinogen oxidase-like [Oppia nitens]